MDAWRMRCVRARIGWHRLADDCKEEKTNRKKKENLLNINLECGWRDGGMADALRAGTDRLADDCKEEKKNGKKKKKKENLLNINLECRWRDGGCVACGRGLVGG